jgi:hypothetical protein
MRRGKYLRSFWSDYSWFIILALGLSSLILGYIGFWKNGLATGEERTILDNLYFTLGLISMNTGAVPAPVSWELQVARFLVPALTAYTAILAFAALFNQQTDRIRLWFVRDHILICGLGRKGFRLAQQFLTQGSPVVIIEVNDDNDWIENVRSSGAIVIQGDATDIELLEKVNLNRARCLISVLGDDGKNAEVAVQAEKLSRQRNYGTLTCVIHIFDSQLWGLLREKELNTNQNTNFRLELFNIFDRGARLMLQGNPPWKISPQNQRTHILVVGLGKMGQRLVVEAARGWRINNPDPDIKMQIFVIDLNAEQKLESLLIHYPRLKDLCEFKALTMDILSGDFERAGSLFIEGKTCNLDLVYICLDDETFSLQTGLRLNHQLRDHQIPIVLRMAESGGLSLLLGEDQSDQETFGNLRIFDLLDQTCTAELLQKGTHEILARNLHAVYLEGIDLSGDDKQSDCALVPWNELSEYLKEKNRRQADRIPVMLNAAGYRIAPLRDWDSENLIFEERQSGEPDEVTLMSALEHDFWCEEKTSEGWRYGPEKDPDQKTNPNLIPWEELTSAEQEKNKEFIRGLPHLLVQAGFQIENHKNTP